MATRLTITTGGDRIVDRSLSRLAGTVQDWTDAWPEIEDVLTDEATKQFDSQGQYGSGGWKANSPSWTAFKKANDLDPRIGHATLKLRKSLCLKGGGEDGVRDAAPGTFLYGTTLPYLKQFSKIRPAVQLPESGRRKVQQTLQAFAMRAAD